MTAPSDVARSDVEWTTADHGGGFGVAVAGDELFHGTGPDGDSLTETWFWGFAVPEAAINCYLYCWVHPNLDVVSTGLIVYEGITPHHLAAELFDFPAFLRASAVVGDGQVITVPNGLTVTVVDPLRHVHIAFEDPGRDTVIDVDLRAVAEPFLRANGLHFEQVMHATGSLRLRGRDHEVDYFAVRDRSWGELRPEAHNPHGPYNWVTAAGEDGSWAFNLGTLDIEGLAPAQAFRDGWLWKDSTVTRLEPRPRVIERTADGRPTAYEVEIVDAGGRRIRASGRVVASVPWSGWHNIVAHLGLVEWTTDDGARGWGETMDCQWNDQVRAAYLG